MTAYVYVSMFMCAHTYIARLAIFHDIVICTCFKYPYVYALAFLAYIPVADNDCTDYCNNGGTCISPGLCICTGNWSGDNCTMRM